MVQRFAAIDALRAGSILYIVGFWHLFAWETPATTRLTVVVLGLFTLVSGRLLGGKSRDCGREGAWRFYASRLLRLYPPYLLFLTLFWAARLIDGTAWLKGSLLLGMLWGPPPVTLWYVGMIMLHYLTVPWLTRAADRGVRYVLACGAVTAALLAFDAVCGTMDVRLVLYFPAFALGVFLGRRRDVLARISLGPALLACLAAAAVSGLSAAHPEQTLWSAPLALSGSLCLFLAARRQEARLGGSRLLAAVSQASFMAYLSHRLAFVGMRHVLGLLALPGKPAFMLLVGVPLIFWGSLYLQRAYDAALAACLPPRPEKAVGG